MNKIYIFKGECDHYAFIKQKAAEKYNNTEIIKTEKGKPYFKAIPNLFFSVSHTDGLTVIALGNSEVGIDVERVKKADLRIIKRFLKEEADYITEKDSNRRFFEIWTKKEAYIKQRGLNISHLSLFDVTSENLKNKFITYVKYSFFLSAIAEASISLKIIHLKKEHLSILQ